MLKGANPKDVAAAALFISFGAFFSLNAFFNLQLGTARQMGPGYFPSLVGLLLVAVGLAIGLRAWRTAHSSFGSVNWRGFALICIAPIVFGVTVRSVGLIPAIALAALLSSFASRRMTLTGALALSIGLTAFCVLAFSYYLNLPIPLLVWPFS